MNTDPAWLVHARAELGVHETPGPVSTKRVLEYRTMAGMQLGGDDGTVPWCAIFVAAMLRLSGLPTTGATAMARSFLHFGVPILQPSPGAIVVFESAMRPAPAGHVGFATGRCSGAFIEVLGGNQGDRVSIATFERKHVIGLRWPLGVPSPTVGPTALASAAPAIPVKDS